MPAVCHFANVFVPCQAPRLPEAIRGLGLREDGEVHRDFARHFAKQNGTMLCVESGSGCLCGFDDWPALYELGRQLLAANRVARVALFFFWASDRYTITARQIDPDDPETCTPLVPGELAVLEPVPVERRRHRNTVRELTRSVGQAVALRLKSGGVRRGRLTAFDVVSEVGMVDAQVVTAGQVLEVIRGKGPT
jgi:small nuclear ribonucleoprotein (snRNP)-like protein